VRNAMVIATVSCVVARGDDGFRVAMGSVAPTPIRLRGAEAMLNAERSVGEAALTEFARLVSAEVDHHQRDLAPVVGVDGSGRVQQRQPALQSEAAARPDLSLPARRQGDLEPGGNEGPLPGPQAA